MEWMKRIYPESREHKEQVMSWYSFYTSAPGRPFTALNEWVHNREWKADETSRQETISSHLADAM